MIGKHIVQSYNEELNKLKTLLVDMQQLSISQLGSVYTTLATNDKDIANKVISNDKEIDKLDSKTLFLCINILSLRNPLASDLRFVFSSTHISRNIERIGDNTKNVAKHILALNERNKKLELLILNMIHDLLQRLHDMKTAFLDHDVELATKIINEDIDIDNLYVKISSVGLEEIKKGKIQADAIHDSILMARYLERIGDHIVNISRYIIFIATGVFFQNE